MQGIDIRQNKTGVIIRAFLADADGDLVTSGNCKLYLYELQDDGTLRTFDAFSSGFEDFVVNPEVPLVHQTFTHADGEKDSGIWTAFMKLTGFSSVNFELGRIYFARIEHAEASPRFQCREFQFGVDDDSFDPFADTVDFIEGTVDSIESKIDVLGAKPARDFVSQPSPDELRLVQGDRYDGEEPHADNLSWETVKNYSGASVKLLVNDGDDVLASGDGTATGQLASIDDFTADIPAANFTGSPRMAKLSFSVIVYDEDGEETIRFGKCLVYHRADID